MGELCDSALPPAALSKQYTIYREKITQDMEKDEILQCWKMDNHTAFCGACLNHMVYAHNRNAEDKEIDSDRKYARLLAKCPSTSSIVSSRKTPRCTLYLILNS